jgi:hypothetical protein
MKNIHNDSLISTIARTVLIATPPGVNIAMWVVDFTTTEAMKVSTMSSEHVGILEDYLIKGVDTEDFPYFDIAGSKTIPDQVFTRIYEFLKQHDTLGAILVIQYPQLGKFRKITNLDPEAFPILINSINQATDIEEFKREDIIPA